MKALIIRIRDPIPLHASSARDGELRPHEVDDVCLLDFEPELAGFALFGEVAAEDLAPPDVDAFYVFGVVEVEGEGVNVVEVVGDAFGGDPEGGVCGIGFLGLWGRGSLSFDGDERRGIGMGGVVKLRREMERCKSYIELDTEF